MCRKEARTNRCQLSPALSWRLTSRSPTPANCRRVHRTRKMELVKSAREDSKTLTLCLAQGQQDAAPAGSYLRMNKVARQNTTSMNEVVLENIANDSLMNLPENN
jgi:hypothetical protein